MGGTYEIWKAAFIIYSLAFTEKAPPLLREEKKRKYMLPSKHFFSVFLESVWIYLSSTSLCFETLSQTKHLRPRVFCLQMYSNSEREAVFPLPSALHRCPRRT